MGSVGGNPSEVSWVVPDIVSRRVDVSWGDVRDNPSDLNDL